MTVTQATFAAEWTWAPNTALSRVAVVLFYIELFPNPIFRRLAIGTIAFVIAYFITLCLTIGLLCRPIQASWDIEIHGSCGSAVAGNIFTAVLNILLDIWVVFLPLSIIWKLQLASQKKWILTAAFSIGLW